MAAEASPQTQSGGSGAGQQAQALVVIPKKAIVTDGSASAVWIVRDGIANRVAITTGRELQDGVEVRSGLDGGELVIIDPPLEIKAGSPVTTGAQ